MIHFHPNYSCETKLFYATVTNTTSTARWEVSTEYSRVAASAGFMKDRWAGHECRQWPSVRYNITKSGDSLAAKGCGSQQAASPDGGHSYQDHPVAQSHIKTYNADFEQRL